MSTDDPPRPLRQGHYRAGIIGLGGIAVNRDTRATHPALGGDPANLAFPAFPDNDDITLFMGEVVPHFA